MKRYPSSREILELLGKGVLIAIALTSPYGGPKILKQFIFTALDKAWETYDQNRLRSNLKRMLKSQMLEIDQSTGEVKLMVSLKGKRQLLKYNLQKMRLERPTVWDQKWRVVIFDILENKKSAREALRRKIKELGFYRLQKSVFVTPYPCDNEIAFLREFFGVSLEVTSFLASDFETEPSLKTHFGLE